MQTSTFLALPLQVLLKKTPLVVFFILLSLSTVYAQQKNFYLDKKDPGWIVKHDTKGFKPAERDISDGYYLAVYENQNHVELQEDYTHIIREIVSDAGVQNGSQISVTYDPSFQKLVFHSVILWRDNKPSDRLKADKFKVLQNEKDLSKFIYSGTFDAFLLLDDIRKGDRIEYSYTVKGTNPVYGNKFASSFYFESSSSIGYTYTNIIANKNRVFNFKNFNFNDPAKISDKDGFKMYEWESKLTKTHRVADFEPNWYNPLRRTQVTEYKNWSEVVDWGLSVNDYANIRTPLLDKTVKQLEKKSGTNQVKYIENAIRFVQDEIRYMGIEMGIYSHRPNSPEKVLNQRYGDCKDKSLLLVYLLKAKNIDAYMAYVDTYRTIKLKDYLPSPFVFNHVVVVVEHDNNKTWVDPTISYQRGTFKNFYFPNYGDALVIKKGINALEPVISIASGKLISELTFNVADTLSENKSTLIVKSTYTDNYADNIRSELAESGVDGIEKSYLEYYGKFYPDIESKAPLKVVDNEETNTIELTESYEISNIWVENQKTGEPYVSVSADLVSSELRNTTAKNRVAPMSLKYPLNIEQTLIVNMPYLSNFGTESFKVENDNYYFELYQSQNAKTITFSYTFRNMNSYIEGSKVKDYIKDKKKIQEYLTYYINRGGTGTTDSNVNFLLVLTLILVAAVTSFFFIKLYNKSGNLDVERLEYARPLGGWLILLAIRIVLIPFMLFVEPVKTGIFDSSVWKNIGEMANSVSYVLKACFVIEVIALALLFNFSLVIAGLFFRKRESFPRLFIIFSLSVFAYTSFDILAAVYIRSLTAQELFTSSDVTLILRSALYTFGWIWYISKSERVKETFVYTYPETAWKLALMKHNDEKFAVKSQIIPNFDETKIEELVEGSEEIKNHENI